MQKYYIFKNLYRAVDIEIHGWISPLFQFNITRLLGRFAPIFYFNCEHVLFVYIVKQNKKSSRILTKKKWIFKIFKKLMKIEFWWRQIIEILIIHKPSLGPREVPHKIWAWSVQPFWRLLDTNRQTDKLNLYIDINLYILC